MNYHDDLIKRYHSIHYETFMPKTKGEWARVVDRLDKNFSSYLDSLNKDSRI